MKDNINKQLEELNKLILASIKGRDVLDTLAPQTKVLVETQKILLESLVLTKNLNFKYILKEPPKETPQKTSEVKDHVLSQIYKYKLKHRSKKAVIAVRINIDIPKPEAGSWFVQDNNGVCFILDNESFTQNYKSVGEGLYMKKELTVWAKMLKEDETIKLKNGNSCRGYAGEMVVYDDLKETKAIEVYAKPYFFERYERDYE